VGTQVESQSWEWKNQYKRSIGVVGKTATQREDVMWTELKVGKLMSELSRKAAIVLYKPVP
jgi:hypothetical protein